MWKKNDKKKNIQWRLTSSATHTADPGILTLESKRPGYFVLNQFFTLFLFIRPGFYASPLRKKEAENKKKKAKIARHSSGYDKKKKKAN